MELARGSVADRPWGMTLGSLGARQCTGQLSLDADGKRYGIAFDHGAVVGASSPLASDSAARVALIHHLISPVQIAEITRQQVAHPEREEIEVLAEIAKLNLDQTIRLRRRVIEQRAARTFSIERGGFVVDSHVAIPVITGLAVDVRAVIYLGARMNLSEQRLADELRPLGAHFVLERGAAGELPAFGFTDAEQPILDALRSGTTLPELEARHRELDPRTVQAVVYALVCCGLCKGIPLPGGLRGGAPAEFSVTLKRTAPTPSDLYSRTNTGSREVISPRTATAATGAARTSTGQRSVRTSTGPVEARTPTGPDATRTSARTSARASTGPDENRTNTGPVEARTRSGPGVVRTSARTSTGPDMARTSTGPDVARTSTGPDANRTPTGPDATRTSGRTSTGPDMARTSTGPDATRTSTGPDASRTRSGPDVARTSTGPDMATTSTGAEGTRTSARTSTGPDPARAQTRPDTARTPTGADPARTATGPDSTRTSARTLTGPDAARTPTGPDGTRTSARATTGPDVARTPTGPDATRTSARTPTGPTSARRPTGPSPSRVATPTAPTTAQGTARLSPSTDAPATSRAPTPRPDSGRTLTPSSPVPRTSTPSSPVPRTTTPPVPRTTTPTGPVPRTALRHAATEAGARPPRGTAPPAEARTATPTGSVDPIAAAREAFQRGQSKMRGEDLVEAIAEFTRAVELTPNEVDYAATLAWARFCAASDKQSLAAATREVLTRAIRKSQMPEIARFYLGRVERMLGRDKEALRHFQEVLELQPKHADAAAEVRVIEARLASAPKGGGLLGRKR